MKLTEEQKQKAEKVLFKAKCPICGSHNIGAIDELTHVIGFATTNNEIDFTKISWINAVCCSCNDCGYVMQFRLDTITK